MSLEHNDNKTFVVINLGNAYITGMVARKRRDGRIVPIATHREESKGSIRYGAIHNVEEVSKIVGQILDELGKSLDDNAIIRGVYVGVACRSMQARPYTTSISLGAEGEIITSDHLQTLRDQAEDARYSGMEILRVGDAHYAIDGKAESNPKGVRGRHLQAQFQIITVRRRVVDDIRVVFEGKLGLIIREILIAPLAEAAISLLPEEALLGSAFINIGAGTTSISIYNNRLLSALYVLPMGGDNVTQDLTDLKLLPKEAERLKCKYGTMVLSKERKDDEVETSSESGMGGRRLKLFDINKYVVARMNEILNNVEHIIKTSDVADDIRSGYVFSGGATSIGGFAEYVKQDEHSRLAKARAQYVAESVGDEDLQKYMTALGLVRLAKEECIEYEMRDLEEVFAPTMPDEPTTPQKPTEQKADDEPDDTGNSIFTGGDDEDQPSSIEEPEPQIEEKQGKSSPRRSIFDRFTGAWSQFKEAINGQEEDEE